MLFSLALSGCGKTEVTIGDAIYNEKTGEMYIDTLENKERIKISYTTGCGLEWIKEAGASFLKLYHDKYYLVLDPDPVLASSLKTTLETGISKTMSDVYFTQNDVWQTWAVRGWMEPLDDVYAYAGNGDTETLENRLRPAFKTVGKNDDHYYAIPWNEIVTGFVYNKTLFDDYGWKVPTTADELVALCEQILKDTDGDVAPFVYPGLAGGYFENVFSGWWIQALGAEAYDEFFNLDSVDLFDPSKPATKGKLAMLENFVKVFGASVTKYSLDGSLATGHIAAQNAMLQEKAAMMPNGNWFEAEMKEDLKDFDLEFRMMALPFINEAQKDADGNYIKINFGCLPELMFVPAKAQNKTGAKEFLKFFNSSAACRQYTKTTGLWRPIDYPTDDVKFSGFAQSAADIRATSLTVVDNPRGRHYIDGDVKKFNVDGSPFLRIVKGEITPEQYCKNEYDYVKSVLGA